jgi:aspartate aminotransferase
VPSSEPNSGAERARLAAAVAGLGTESAFAVLARAQALEAEGREVVHLEIGEPDFATAPHVVEAAVESLRAGRTGYSTTAGTAELREAAARDLSARRGIEVGAEEVLIGNGAKPFLLFTVLALCEPGDEVIVPDPGFPIYESAVRFAGATPVPLPVAEAGGFGLDLNALAKVLGPRTKLVILNFPHNPTGGAADRAELDAAAALIARTSAWVLSDEVYSRYLYEGEFASIASTAGMLDRTVLLDGLSKGHAMTGWRCGFAAVPEPLRDAIARFFVNSTSCVPPFVQDGAVAALTGPQDQAEAMVAEFRARRDLLVAGLNAVEGVRCAPPRGAFYAFPNVEAVPGTSGDLARGLLEDAGVATLDGASFGPGGEGHLRLSYASSRASLELALERIGAYLGALG